MVVNQVGREPAALMSASEPLVEVVRGGLVEAVHRGVVAVVDATGVLRASVGDPRRTTTYWRSAAKPFQALPVVSSGAAETFGLSSEQLAIIAASHSGEPVHVAQVSRLLDDVGCSAGDLACGVHRPLDPQASANLWASGIAPSVLHNNCSGKHAGMLALARQLGVEPVGYESPHHPVQLEILESVARFAGVPSPTVVVGVDGCGVPCFGTSVYHLALAFARLVDPSGLDEPHARAARAIRGAMIAHPHLVAGTARFDTDLIRAGGGELVAKGGAAGVQGVGLAGGVGIAVKIEDGSDAVPGRPSSVVAIEALRQLEALAPVQLASLDAHARPVLRTIRGDRVGEALPVFTLAPAASSEARAAADG